MIMLVNVQIVMLLVSSPKRNLDTIIEPRKKVRTYCMRGDMMSIVVALW